MKELVTAFAACAIAGAAMAQVPSNIVGYYNQDGGGYRISIPSFVAIGQAAGQTTLNDLLDTSVLEPYVDDVQVYNPGDGTYAQYMWDGADWTDFSDTFDILVEPGKGFVFGTLNNIVFKGEVIDAPTFKHDIPEGYSIFGSAFPVPLKLSKFNFDAVLEPYANEMQVYDAASGDWYGWMWDGVGFTDFADYLPDEVAPIGQGVLLGNDSGVPIEVTETL